MSRTTIAVAVSGGVDSLYALASLCAQGKDVLALHARFRPQKDSDPVPGLERACRVLGVPLHVADLEEPFRRLVMLPFAQAYAAAETPNPCALCNRELKFGLLLDKARELGAARLATGHYAALAEHPAYGLCLRKAADAAKDQSYFLALVPQKRLAAAFFPLAMANKSQVRETLLRQGLEVPLPVESQEICFVPNDDYRAFVAGSGVILPGPGPILLADGRKIGTHEGLWRYTEGQRRGLGVAWSEPLYVIEKNAAANTLLAGTRTDLNKIECDAGEVNLLVDPALWPAECMVRTRYRQAATLAKARVEDGRLLVRFHVPQPIPAPGQIVAVFDAEGHVLAGGVIGR